VELPCAAGNGVNQFSPRIAARDKRIRQDWTTGSREVLWRFVTGTEQQEDIQGSIGRIRAITGGPEYYQGDQGYIRRTRI